MNLSFMKINFIQFLIIIADDTFNHYYNVMEKQFSDISLKCQKTLCKEISDY